MVTVGVIVLLVVGLEAVVYLSLRDRLTDSLDEVLVTRAALVQRLARGRRGPRCAARRADRAGRARRSCAAEDGTVAAQ